MQFQFFTKGNNFTFSRVDCDNYANEKAQLLAQGFELIEQVIKADDLQEAVNKFRTFDQHQMKKLTIVTLLASLNTDS